MVGKGETYESKEQAKNFKAVPYVSIPVGRMPPRYSDPRFHLDRYVSTGMRPSFNSLRLGSDITRMLPKTSRQEFINVRDHQDLRDHLTNFS